MTNRIPYTSWQVQEIIRSIKRGECPLKYAYFGKGAERFALVRNNPKYHLAEIETTLLSNKATNILHQMGKPSNINVIDLGCGDGKKASALLGELVRLGRKVRYYAVDISPVMIDKAIETVTRLNSVEPDSEVLDFESNTLSNFTEEVRSGQFQKNLILFLGHTLGNVSNTSAVLSNIRESMGSEDYLLLGVELFDQQRLTPVKEEYDFPEMHDLVFTTMEYLGVPRSIGRFPKPSFINKQVVLTFIVREHWEKRFRKTNLTLERGKRIVLAHSSKFTKSALSRLMLESRFSLLDDFTDKDAKFQLSLCKVCS